MTPRIRREGWKGIECNFGHGPSGGSGKAPAEQLASVTRRCATSGKSTDPEQADEGVAPTLRAEPTNPGRIGPPGKSCGAVSPPAGRIHASDCVGPLAHLVAPTMPSNTSFASMLLLDCRCGQIDAALPKMYPAVAVDGSGAAFCQGSAAQRSLLALFCTCSGRTPCWSISSGKSR